MSVGLLREHITICRPQVSTDSAGFTTRELVEVAVVRAFVEQRRATGAWVNRAAYTNATTLFRIRTIPDLTLDERMVIQWRGQDFEVESVEDLRGRYVEILARCTTPQGHTDERSSHGSGSD